MATLTGDHKLKGVKKRRVQHNFKLAFQEDSVNITKGQSKGP
jgi:hypothetical protein